MLGRRVLWGGVGEPIVLFDLDGTLVDSAPGIIAAHRHALGALGIEVDQATLRRWIGPGLRDALTGLGVPDRLLEEAVSLFRSYYTSAGVYQSRLYEGIAEMLEELGQDGNRLGVATSKLTALADQLLAHFGLSGYFEVVSGSTPDRRREGKGAIIAHALERLGRPGASAVSPGPVCMVGDTEWDVVGARQNGARPVGVTWGYGTEEELWAAGAEVVVGQPSELAARLRAWAGPAEPAQRRT